MKNEDGYEPYAAANPAIFKKFGGRFLVRGGKFDVAEGNSRARNVIIEFPDYASALACYRSPEYQENIKVPPAALHNRTNRHRGLRRPTALNMGAAMPARRFPPPWSVEVQSACFVMRDRDGQALAYVYFENEPASHSALPSCSANIPGLVAPRTDG